MSKKVFGALALAAALGGALAMTAVAARRPLVGGALG